MISQVTNSSAGTVHGNTEHAAPLVDVKPQKPAAPVELPSHAVKAVAEVDTATARKAAEQINKALKQFDNNIQFSVDENNKTNVKIVDTQTKEVIRQLPTKEMLAIAQALDKFQGLLIKIKA